MVFICGVFLLIDLKIEDTQYRLTDLLGEDILVVSNGNSCSVEWGGSSELS